MSEILGIDFGNKNCVLSLPLDGEEEKTIFNKVSPTMVTYTNERRYACELSQQQQMEYYKTTITKIKSLIGLKYDSIERKQIESLSAYSLVELEDGFTGVKIQYDNADVILRPEQIVAYLLKSLVKISQTHNQSIDKCILSVCPWWTNEQRQILLNAIKIGEINCLGLINSTTAAAVSYIKLQESKLPPKEAKPVPIMIIDLGDFALNVAVALVKKDYVHIAAMDSDDTLGGMHFTNELLPYLVSRTVQKYNLDPHDNPRAWIRFQDACEKLKMTLSINQAVDFDVSCLMNDVDVNFLVKREDFNQRIQGLISRIHEPIMHALELAGIKREDLYAVEIVAGGGRVPLVKEAVFQTVGKEFAQVLNANESFAGGVAVIGRKLVGEEKDLDIEDITNTEISANWKEGEESVEKLIFKRYSKTPSMMKFKVKVDGKSTVDFVSDKGKVGTLELDYGNENVTVEVEVRLSISNVFSVYAARVIAEEGKPVPEGKFTYKAEFEISEEDLAKFKELEAKMTANDAKECAIDEAKNNLESLIFEAKNGLNRDFPDNFDPQQLNKYKKDVQDIEDWFSEHEFDRFPNEEYKTRIDAIESFFRPAQNRFKLFRALMDEVAPLKDRASELQTLLKTQPDRIDGGEKEALLKEVNDFIECVSKAMSEPKFEDPTFKAEQYISRLKTIESRLSALSNLPLKPAPEPQKKPTVVTVDEADDVEEPDDVQEVPRVPSSPRVEEPQPEEIAKPNVTEPEVKPKANGVEEVEDDEVNEDDEDDDDDQIYDFWGHPIGRRNPQNKGKRRNASNTPRRPSYVEEPKDEDEEEEEKEDDEDDYLYDAWGRPIARRTPPKKPECRCREVVCEDGEEEEYFEHPLATLLGFPQRKKKQQKKKVEKPKQQEKHQMNEEELIKKFKDYQSNYNKKVKQIEDETQEIDQKIRALVNRKKQLQRLQADLGNDYLRTKYNVQRAIQQKRQESMNRMYREAAQNYVNQYGGDPTDFLSPAFRQLFQQAFRQAYQKQMEQRRQQQQAPQQTQQRQTNQQPQQQQRQAQQPRCMPRFRGPFWSADFGGPFFF